MTMQNQNAAQTSEYEYQDVTQLQVAVGESTLNPYEMTTDTSLQVVPLLYDSLTKLNLHYGYDLCIASSLELQGTSCVVTLRQDVRFSDGTALTAADVQYSYWQAVGSENAYAAQLSNVTDVSILSDYQIRFTLMEADVLFPNLLTFPILKNGSAADPVGSGRYRLGRGKICWNRTPIGMEGTREKSKKSSWCSSRIGKPAFIA